MTPAPRMSCAELEALLQPYLDGEFDGEERRDVERHLDLCGRCARHIASEASFRDALRRSLSDRKSEERAPERLKLTIGAKIAEEDRRARLTRFARLSAAALVLLTAGGSYLALRPGSQRPYVDDAALWHARQLPTEIAGDDPARVERWFGGKLDHRVPVPRFANTRVAGARLSLVKDRPAAYITYVANPDGDSRRVGLFVYADSAGAVGADTLPSVAVAQSHGYNVALWREGEIVYQLVSDLDESDIRRLLGARTRGGHEVAAPAAEVVALEADDHPFSFAPPPASFAATLGPSLHDRTFDVRPASLQH